MSRGLYWLKKYGVLFKSTFRYFRVVHERNNNSGKNEKENSRLSSSPLFTFEFLDLSERYLSFSTIKICADLLHRHETSDNLKINGFSFSTKATIYLIELVGLGFTGGLSVFTLSWANVQQVLSHNAYI